MTIRQRVEIAVIQEDHILVTVNPTDTGVWYGLPGGGVEPGQTEEEACEAECLEEVGIRFNHLTKTKFQTLKEGYVARSSQSARETQYSGSKTTLYAAEFHRLDTEHLDMDDACQWCWMPFSQALAVLSTGSGTHQQEFLTDLMSPNSSTRAQLSFLVD